MTRYYVRLGEINVCDGIQTANGTIVAPNYIEVTSDIQSGLRDLDWFMWRKYENGQWSAEKFLPPAPVTGPSAEEQIAVLDERTVGMQAIDDFTLQAQATIDERTVGMQEIDDFTLLQVTDLQQQVDQLKADVAALKGGV